ncbi:hypothetical protein ABK040_002162 [Willaertia magna]
MKHSTPIITLLLISFHLFIIIINNNNNCKLYAAPKPYFPPSYTSDIIEKGRRERNDIHYKIYYSYERKEMRFDSFGIPELLSKSDFSSLKLIEKERYYYLNNQKNNNLRGGSIKGKNNKLLQEDKPLYIFFFRYSEGLMYSLFPSPSEDAWQCVTTKLPLQSNIPTLYNQPFIVNATYLGEREIEDEDCFHFYTDYSLFSIDYFQSAITNLPKKLVAGYMEMAFENFNATKPDDSVFLFPKNTGKCTDPK